eukprot:TRINITY_DN2028_c3_g1_i2.p1 TRINITY_DN2028_c3_g1~~TRINITY_DN2028_c3_g1_i2.p1  ORF type:complete len:362 (-),score=80.44 TRINITY_DN2028_c3_g1_i2:403-1488(-)
MLLRASPLARRALLSHRGAWRSGRLHSLSGRSSYLRLQSCACGTSSKADAETSSQNLQVVKPTLGGGGSLMAAVKAQPLFFDKEMTVFESSVDILEVMAEARSRAVLGAGLAATGFGAVLITASTFLAPPALAVLALGGAANCYALAVIVQRVLLRTAVRHVERITILPTLDHSGSPPPEEEDDNSINSLLSSAATFEQRLLATPELRLEIRQAGAVRYLSLVDRLEDADDDRAAFGDICTRSRLIDIDADAGACADRSLLDAVMMTAKVAAEERVESRRDDISTGIMLSEVTTAEIDEVGSVAAHVAPPHAMRVLGLRARNGGMSIFAAAVLFAVGESARDEDGVARFNNLPNLQLPGLG